MFHISACREPVFPAAFVKETYLLQRLFFAPLSKIQWLYVLHVVISGVFTSATLVYTSVFVPVPGCFVYNCHVVCFEVWYFGSSSFVFVA